MACESDSYQVEIVLNLKSCLKITCVVLQHFPGNNDKEQNIYKLIVIGDEATCNNSVLITILINTKISK
jgi:hypothetical protein